MVLGKTGSALLHRHVFVRICKQSPTQIFLFFQHDDSLISLLQFVSGVQAGDSAAHNDRVI